MQEIVEVQVEEELNDNTEFKSAGKTFKWRMLKHWAIKDDYRQQLWWVSDCFYSNLRPVRRFLLSISLLCNLVTYGRKEQITGNESPRRTTEAR